MSARLRTPSLLALLLLLLAPSALAQSGQSRLKDLVVIEGAAPVQLTGYGLVVGLDRTGDRASGRRGSPHTIQSIANMLQRFNITVDPALLTSRNAAAVMVTTTLDPFAGPGASADVTVSALGDARSLTGGVLLQTPLVNVMTGQVHAMAQGPVSTGAILAASAGSSVQSGHTNTGRVPGGALVTAGSGATIESDAGVGLVLRRPDFTNAIRIADAVNAEYPDAATVEHGGLVRIAVPDAAGSAAALVAALEGLRVDVDVPARIVINERTGTVVAGGDVQIARVMVTSGNITIATQADPLVSQPNPLAQGETVTAVQGAAGFEEDGARSVVLGASADVNELAAALNDLGVSAREVIAIFQAIDRAGALQGELVIL